jgi:hypothetical protein
MRPVLPAALFALTLAAACGLPPLSTDPVAARLSQTELTVTLQNGQTCRIPRAQAAQDGPQGWGGPVAGCAGVVSADVVFQPRPAPPLGIIPALIAALSLDGVFAQYADVRLAGPDGRTFVFATPEPPGDWD